MNDDTTILIPKDLKQMTEVIYNEAPHLVNGTRDEYLKNLPAEERNILENKFKNKKYFDAFTLALTHCSQILYVAMQVAQDVSYFDEKDFQKCAREFLMYTKEDDKEIFKMRLFYLNSIDTEALKEHMGDDYDHQKQNKFELLIQTLKDKYVDLKSYLN